ncbi:MAG: peptidoglycan-binding protein, partial [Firmicutes bacterium]|nr:peptidoglycan-binding protein [Bacillota bacterium]
VDGLFNVYAHRIGFKNPFFTSFCNGTTSTCNGLSQWGTVELANQGKTPLDILHNYYIDDLELSVAEYGDTVSYPGTPLTAGTHSQAVKDLQDMLNTIRLNYPLIPYISNADGTYNQETVNAVKVFQSVFNLTQDGVTGRATWYKIGQIYAAVLKLSELDSDGERIGLSPTPPTVTIRQGNTGTDVLHAQFLLNYISNFYPTITAPAMDGRFGPDMTTSVKEFQRKFGLTADGVIGAGTWRKLYEVYMQLRDGDPNYPDTLPPPPPGGGNGGGNGGGSGGGTTVTTPPYPGYLLRQGQRGDNICALQRLLNGARAQYPSLPTLSIDCIFGPATLAAVRAFQRLAGLSVDGIVGQQTWSALQRAQASNPTTPPVAPDEHFPFTGTLRLGDRGTGVSMLQELLQNASTVYPQIPRVPKDGVFGQSTHNAVLAFQKLFELAEDGLVGQQTWASLVALWNYQHNTLDTTLTAQGLSPYPGPLQQTRRGNGVLALQIMLNTVRQSIPSLPTLSQDGIFGAMTAQALRHFQQLMGLPQTGVLDFRSWDALAIMLQTLSEATLPNDRLQTTPPSTMPQPGAQNQIQSFWQTPQTTPTPPTPFVATNQTSPAQFATTNAPMTPTMDAPSNPYPGSLALLQSGPQVLRLQQMLNNAASLHHNLPRIQETGTFDTATQNSVRLFQHLSGLTVDGIPGRQTWNALTLLL